MRRKWLTIGLSLLLVFTLVACNSDDGGTEESKAEVSGSVDEDFTVTMVSDEGGINDQSYNQTAHEGLEKVKEDFGIDINYQESHQAADYAPNFEILLDIESDLIWGVGYKLADETYDSAINNPDTLYGIVDYSFEDDPDYPEGTPENLVGVLFKAEQPSFLVGYIAGMMTESDSVGFIGGDKGDAIGLFDYGYQAGVNYAAKELDKDIDISIQYVESFSDASKGKSMATSMYQQGKDIVFHAAGGAGDGVIEAAKEEDKWVIGVDKDQHYMAPDNVLTSAMKRVDVGIYNVVEDLVDDDFPSGQTVTYGLEDEGAVDIAPSSEENVPTEILEKVEEIKQDIIDGKIIVPNDEKSLEDFLSNL
ncbi:MAG TPA: BMP family ABC transporter substrate-binding protein [Tissierellaceae bacterium]|nr:BMP family ABC transporter substrate-binding protein [Tissierellaceae bacterium]